MPRTLFILFALIMIAPAISLAQQGSYVSLSGGVTFLNDSTSTIEHLSFDDPFLAGADFGKFTMEEEFKTGFHISGAIGYDFDPFRLEGELRYTKNKIDKILDPVFTAELSADGSEITLRQSGSTPRDTTGEFTSTSLLINAYYDFKNSSIFTPFVMTGMGLAEITFDDTQNKMQDTVFAYQAGVGISTLLGEKTVLDLSYRYFATEDPEFKQNEPYPLPEMENDYKSHNISLGVRYLF